MAQVKPMLGEIELQLVQQLEVDGTQVIVEHGIPALEGDFLQGLGRRATSIALSGVLTGTEAGKSLKDLREKFRSAEPVSFVANINTATKIDKVIIEEMKVKELAGKPERFEYAFSLREYIPIPESGAVDNSSVDKQVKEQASEINSEQIENAASGLGILEVQVDVHGGDYSGIIVVVEGDNSLGKHFSTWSKEQVNGVYTFTNLQEGKYMVRLEVQ